MYADFCMIILVSCCTGGGTRTKNKLKLCHVVFEGICCPIKVFIVQPESFDVTQKFGNCFTDSVVLFT